LAWRRSIEAMEAGTAQPRTLSLFPEDRGEGLVPDGSIVELKLSQVRLRRPAAMGCLLADAGTFGVSWVSTVSGLTGWV
jgi:hypothetical protein